MGVCLGWCAGFVVGLLALTAPTVEARAVWVLRGGAVTVSVVTYVVGDALMAWWVGVRR